MRRFIHRVLCNDKRTSFVKLILRNKILRLVCLPLTPQFPTQLLLYSHTATQLTLEVRRINSTMSTNDIPYFSRFRSSASLATLSGPKTTKPRWLGASLCGQLKSHTRHGPFDQDDSDKPSGRLLSSRRSKCNCTWQGTSAEVRACLMRSLTTLWRDSRRQTCSHSVDSNTTYTNVHSRAFGSIGHRFESEHRLFSHHSATAYSKLRSLA